MKITLLRAAALAALLPLTCGAKAALVSQGGYVVLDNVNNLLWFSDRPPITRLWADDVTWAAALTVGSLPAGSWSLASAAQWNSLAAAAGGSAQTLFDLGISGQYYFLSNRSGSDALVAISSSALAAGNQIRTVDYRNITYDYGSLAVAAYPGPTAVPVPATAWLMLTGLGAIGAAARRRKAACSLQLKTAPVASGVFIGVSNTQVSRSLTHDWQSIFPESDTSHRQLDGS
jgi:hypothetical protein